MTGDPNWQDKDRELSPKEMADEHAAQLAEQLAEIEAELFDTFVADVVLPNTELLSVQVRVVNYGRELHLRTEWRGASPRYVREIATISDRVKLAAPHTIDPEAVTKAFRGVRSTYDMMMEPRRVAE